MSGRNDFDATAPVAAAASHAVKFNRGPSAVTVAQLHDFDEIVDVRSEDEFSEDHVPGATSCPVLTNEERARVGTLYKQVSSFEAKKIGAALISANISRHLRERFHDRPRNWRPLVYCWRGGSRSGALAHVLHQVGWRVAQLDGGYRAYRRQVLADLAVLPARFGWRAVCGLTGSGKSRLLLALNACGAQTLDLEDLAAHRGSVLGTMPDREQPAQKMFDSLVWDALRRMSPSRPVYVEAESKKIGALRVPESLIAAMWESPCVLLEAPAPVRVELLKSEYAHFMGAPHDLVAKLEGLSGLHGHAVISEWRQLAYAGRWDELTENLLTRHYDPAYTRSTLKHYPRLNEALRLQVTATDEAEFMRLARHCLACDAGGRQ
ncbi:MAG: tRNA 2-selenouridine(34) synthase MnmH [Betaproteobacteria bacterium]